MSTVIQYALLGLGISAIYALLGQGILLIHRGSGVLNIAHGGFAMIGAYLYLQFHAPSSLGESVSAGGGWPVLPAAVAAVAVTAMLGVLTDRLVLRPMRNASPLARLIAMVGVLVVLQASATKIWGSQPPFVQPLLTSDIWTFGSEIKVPASYIWLLVIAVVITVVLTAIWRYSRAGWVMSAVSENSTGSAALGISPGVVSSVTWGAGCAMAAVAGILVAPITQVSATSLSLLVIPTLAAVLLGGFQSFPKLLLGALAVGVTQTIALNYNSFFEEHLHVTSASDAVPLLIIAAVMLSRGTSLPQRGEVIERLPAIGSGRVRWRLVIPPLVVLLVLIFAVFSGNTLATLGVTFAVAILLLSLVVVTGYAGQLSLAQFTIAGIGGLIAARLSAGAGLGFVPALVLGTIGASAVGVLFALPALRARGVSLAVISLAMAWAANDMVFSNQYATGTAAGVHVGTAEIFGLAVGGSDEPSRYAAMTLILFVLAALVVASIRRSGLGRQMIAVRSNERAAAASGVSVFAVKIVAFAIGGALAGLSGVLLAFQYREATFLSFDPFTSMLSVVWVVIGGVGYIFATLNPGATIAPGGVASLIGLQWDAFVSWLPLLGGVISVVAVVLNQDGITHSNVRAFHRSERKRTAGRADSLPKPAIEPRGESPEVVRVASKPLRVEGLTVRYGAVKAVDGISVSVGPGEVVGLIGPNGAGKTSLMDAVTGFIASEGQVELDGKRIEGWAPHRRAGAGLVRSFQGLELFSEMTVLENLQVANDAGADAITPRALIRRRRSPGLSPVTHAAIEEFGLRPLLERTPDEISYGERRLVGIARAVAAQPSILLLDEPAAGLSDDESKELVHLVRRLADVWGMGLLVVEHNMDFVMTLCDRVTVVDFGEFVCDGTPDEVRANPAAIAAYLGEPVDPEATPASEGTDR